MTQSELRGLKALKKQILKHRREYARLNVTDPRAQALSDTLEKEIRDCKRQLNRLCDWIDRLEDSKARQIFYYHYIKGLSWNAVAAEMGGFFKGDAARKIAARCLKRVKE